MPCDFARLDTAIRAAATAPPDSPEQENALCEALRGLRAEAQKPLASSALADWFGGEPKEIRDPAQVVQRYLCAVQLFDCGRYAASDTALSLTEAGLIGLRESGAYPRCRLLTWSLRSRRALVYWRVGSYGALRKLAEEGLARPDLPPRLRAELCLALAAAADRGRDAARCRQYLRQTEAVIQELGGAREMLAITGQNLLLAQASLALLEGDLEQSARRHEQAVTLAEALGLPREQAHAVACQARLALYAGQQEQIEPLVREAQRLAAIPGECWHVELLGHWIASQRALQQAELLGNLRDALAPLAPQIEHWREQAIGHAEEAYRISQEHMGVPRERFRQARNLAEVLARTCDRDAVLHQHAEQAQRAAAHLDRALKHLSEALNCVALIEEPFAAALAHQTAAVVHDHHSNCTSARQNYETSLAVLRQYTSGYRLLQLQLQYGRFLRQRLQLPEFRSQGLALLAEGRHLAAERRYADLVQRFDTELTDIPQQDWVQALAQAAPQAARAAAFRLIRHDLCRGLRHDLGHAVEDLASALQDQKEKWMKYIEGLLDRLTELSATESPGELRRETYHPHGQVQAILDRRRSVMGPVSLINDVPKGLRIYGDQLLIGQAVENFIHNAAKAIRLLNDRREHRITLSGRSERDFVIIAVTDTGGGVAEDARAALFSGQRGLGLAFADFIARWHGGRARLVRSTDGEGAEFAIEIPHKPR